MPLYDYVCSDCGKSGEVLILGTGDAPECRFCGSRAVKKLVSAHSSASGTAKNRLPGPGDTGCCGSSPAHASCEGPGSCCGHR